jgi:hypothetical protein
MGQLRFVAPQRDRLVPGAVEQAYLTGMEAVPFPSRNYWHGDQLVIEREVRESGNLHILWRLPGQAPLLLSTASLMERERPYLLPVELARGTLNRLRQQQAVWQSMGLTTPPDYKTHISPALAAFAQAATHQSNPLEAAAYAEQSLEHTFAAMQLLGGAYVEQVLALRHEQSPALATLLGAELPTQALNDQGTRMFQTAFNAAIAPLLWRGIEPTEGEFDWTLPDRQFQWLRGKPLKVVAGPLLRLDTSSLPDWIYLWEEDFEALQGYIHEYLTAVVNRYKGQVQVWNCAAGLNLPGGLSLNEEQKLRLAVLAVDTVRRADPRTPVVISFDQPWGEYLQQEEMDLPPYHFADALVRADLGLSGVGLEINMGYWPGGSLPRDVLELGRLVDRWSMLGVPLLVQFCSPSASGPDPLAMNKTATVDDALSPAAQTQWLAPRLEMLLAKQCMHGVLWNQFADSDPHRWPHSGLLDAAGAVKPLVATLTALRKRHLA